METIINSSYLITVGTLIGYERKMKCKELAGTKAKEPYKQIPFCEGICCVQTYRNIEKATLEVKAPIYEQFLEKLGYQMEYDDVLYKEINYRLQNLNDAIEKYDLDSVFLIVDKLNELIPDKHNDIYYSYLNLLIKMIYLYFKNNELPDNEFWIFLCSTYHGYPIYIKDVMIDFANKHALLNMENDSEYFLFAETLGLDKSNFVLNQLNYLQYLCLNNRYDEFYVKAEAYIKNLNSRELYLRIIDIYDIKTYADLETNPTKIFNDLDDCSENIDKLLKKLKIDLNRESSQVPPMIKRKLSQHYYHIGYSLMNIKEYGMARKHLELSLEYDDVFEIICKVFLINCYDRLKIKRQDQMKSLYTLNRQYDINNKHYILYEYYIYRNSHQSDRDNLKYLKKNVIDFILPEDKLLLKIVLFELNNLAKATSNYQILQEFIEKMGIID